MPSTALELAGDRILGLGRPCTETELQTHLLRALQEKNPDSAWDIMCRSMGLRLGSSIDDAVEHRLREVCAEQRIQVHQLPSWQASEARGKLRTQYEDTLSRLTRERNDAMWEAACRQSLELVSSINTQLDEARESRVTAASRSLSGVPLHVLRSWLATHWFRAGAYTRNVAFAAGAHVLNAKRAQLTGALHEMAAGGVCLPAPPMPPGGFGEAPAGGAAGVDGRCAWVPTAVNRQEGAISTCYGGISLVPKLTMAEKIANAAQASREFRVHLVTNGVGGSGGGGGGGGSGGGGGGGGRSYRPIDAMVVGRDGYLSEP